MAQPCTLAHMRVAAEVTREQGANKLQRWEGHEGQAARDQQSHKCWDSAIMSNSKSK